ncbi:MAG: RnfH family protein [Gammaproteobacteria bacterium]|nr:RnfH family protein [Gammaproteobacteria bacterium]
MAVERAHVEVVYAAPGEQWAIALDVPQGTTLRGALERARVFERYPPEVTAVWSYGIFGVPCAMGAVLGDGDRIEIYRPLADDPKAIRRRRGARQRARHTPR